MRAVLIANRGEVAVRVSRAVRQMGMKACGVHDKGRADAAHLRWMDSHAALPGVGHAAFLDPDALLSAASRLNADALHPGWGFLSESPLLAEACAQAGVTFIGPPARLLRLFGDKRLARDEAIRAGLNVCESAGSIEEARSLLRHSPILLKPAEGGGGRGMRIVRDVRDLEAAWDDACREASAAFGQSGLFAERLIENARHVEIQIAGDGDRAVSLGTRDCSLQRRQQKLAETAPARVPTDLAERAAGMAQSLGYQGLGTWEFLVHGEEAWFLEVNPRLQVEHTVTEAVTGLDLVCIQLALAQGQLLEALGLLPPQAPRGFAIELRINAETIRPDGDVIPQTGMIAAFLPPSGPGIRMDHAIRDGMVVDTAFDSLLAKLIVHGPDRASALARAKTALDELKIEGVPTNAAALRRLLDTDPVRQDDLHTRTLETLAAIIAGPAEAHQSAGAGQIEAPMAGTLSSLLAAPGDVVRPGQRVALIEAMKMQMEVKASIGGTILSVGACEGDVVAAGQVLITVAPSGDAPDMPEEAGPAPETIRPDLAALGSRLLATRDEARPDAVARRHAAGGRTARENLAHLFDPDSFSEYGALAVAAQRRRRSMEELIRISPADGLIAGIGTVDERPAAALAYDYTVMAGTQGFLNHKKADRLLGIVHRDRLPLVLFAEGGGGRPGDTDVMGVAGLDLSTFAAFASCSGRAPLIGIANGYCFAGNAALLGCCDTIIATRTASIGMGGPAMIEGGGLGVFRPEQVGPVSVQEPNGVIDLLVQDEAEAVHAARRLLAYLSPAETLSACADQRLLRHAVPEDRKRAYDMRALIAALADQGSVTELRRGYAPGMITSLLRIGGQSFGVLANNPMHLGGAIDAPAADKAARFMHLCDSHGLPLLSLCDTPGFIVGPDAERTAQVRRVCRLFITGASLSVPVFCVVPRKGYGLGAMAMAAGGFHQTRFTIAWPSGEFGGMGLEGAVRLGFRRELDAEPDPDKKKMLFEALLAKAYADGQAINMASYVEIDAVIDPSETRDWIRRGLSGVRLQGSGRPISPW